MRRFIINSMHMFCLVCILVMSNMQAAHAIEQAKLQRGALFFMNYCSGCHSLKYMRYSRMAHDLCLPTTGSDDPLQNSLPEQDATHWFGQMPPDLSLTAREKGPTWITTYLTSFYPDNTRPFGVNNRLVSDSSMPDVLAPLKEHVNQGYMSQQTLDDTIQDVVSFLVYVAEPARLVRYRMGFFVMFFLFVFGLLLYRADSQVKCNTERVEF